MRIIGYCSNYHLLIRNKKMHVNIDEAIAFEQSSLSDLFRAKGQSGEAGSFADAIAGTVEEWEELVACYKGALMEMRTRFEVLNEQFAVRYHESPIETIKARLKKPESIHEKLLRLGP